MFFDKFYNKKRKKLIKGVLILFNPIIIFILIIALLLMMVCYITDIFYIGIKNEEKSNMKKEVKYYTTAEYNDEDSKSFFDSVGEFISGIFGKEIISDAEFPVVGKSTKDITSYYGKRVAPTTGASTFHSRN